MNVEQARQKLEAERDRLTALKEGVVEQAGLDEEQSDTTGNLASYDQHPGDAGTETFERTKDLAVESQIDDRLEEVDRALERITDGTYGTCEVCGRDIDPERLEAVPATRYCREHQQEADAAAGQEREYGFD